MPSKAFLHNMGVASILAGVILLGMAKLAEGKRRIKRAVRRAR